MAKQSLEWNAKRGLDWEMAKHEALIIVKAGWVPKWPTMKIRVAEIEIQYQQ
jgi:hypothetical protein